MKIGDRVKVVLGAQFRLERVEAGSEDVWAVSYPFLDREGIVVRVTGNLALGVYGIHLDGDYRPDGSPTIRYFNTDQASCIEQVVELVQAADVSEAEAYGRFVAQRESVNQEIRAHNAKIETEIVSLQHQIAALESITAGAQSSPARSEAQRNALDQASRLTTRLQSLRQTLLKERPIEPPVLGNSA